MWYEAIPSMIAMGAAMSLIELSPFVTHYISWGCPMMRNTCNEISEIYVRRDQRIAEHNGVKWYAKHMYTYGLSALDQEVKQKGNFDNYIEAECKLNPSSCECNCECDQ